MMVNMESWHLILLLAQDEENGLDKFCESQEQIKPWNDRHFVGHRHMKALPSVAERVLGLGSTDEICAGDDLEHVVDPNGHEQAERFPVLHEVGSDNHGEPQVDSKDRDNRERAPHQRERIDVVVCGEKLSFTCSDVENSTHFFLWIYSLSNSSCGALVSLVKEILKTFRETFASTFVNRLLVKWGHKAKNKLVTGNNTSTLSIRILFCEFIFRVIYKIF